MNLKASLILLVSTIIGVFSISAYSSDCPAWPAQSTRMLAAADLQNCDCNQLELLRNEIFARHGRKFRRKALQDYFESQPWYKYDPNNPLGNRGLNNFERRNSGFILNFEKKKGCRAEEEAGQCPEWPAQSTRSLSAADLGSCDCGQLELLRNEIFARHGRKFKRQDLRDYFESQQWYKSDPNNPDGNRGLNSFEKRNSGVILNYEKNRGCQNKSE